MINLQSLLYFLREVVTPPFCFYCREYIYYYGLRASDPFLCDSCARLIKPIISTRIDLGNGLAIPVHAVAAYEDPLKTLILAKNYADYGASKQLARIMSDYSMAKHIPFDCVVPLPAHWTRTARRGYNQAEVIARELARLSGKPLLLGLTRVRRTKKQAECAVGERTKNVQDAFALTPDGLYATGMAVVLVDDLMTTGATLYAAGKELIRANPKELYALVASRVL